MPELPNNRKHQQLPERGRMQVNPGLIVNGSIPFFGVPIENCGYCLETSPGTNYSGVAPSFGVDLAGKKQVAFIIFPTPISMTRLVSGQPGGLSGSGGAAVNSGAAWFGSVGADAAAYAGPITDLAGLTPTTINYGNMPAVFWQGLGDSVGTAGNDGGGSDVLKNVHTGGSPPLAVNITNGASGPLNILLTSTTPALVFGIMLKGVLLAGTNAYMTGGMPAGVDTSSRGYDGQACWFGYT